MKNTLTKIFAGVALALSLAGCESQQDIDAKPAVVQTMVENSAAVCPLGPVNAEKAQYEERLTKVLSDVSTQKLEAIRDAKITVCLDQREAAQTTSLWSSTIEGVYYPNAAAGNGVIGLWDNGLQPAEVGAFYMGSNAYYRGGDVVEKFGEAVQKGTLPTGADRLYAGLYGKYSHASWDSAQDFSQKSIARNPQLNTPPTR